MMLNRFASPSNLDADLQRYLHEILGLMPEIRGWDRHTKTPYYLRDAFEFRELILLDRQMVLAADRRTKSPPAASIREQIDALERIAEVPVAYVTTALASYERKRLIRQKVPFIVPGNQLYLPALGIDLREYFRKRTQASEAPFNPSTQAMLLASLLRTPWDSIWRPAEVAAKLGYTPMTASRAVRELTEAGIAERRRERRTQWLNLGDRPNEIWERSKPFLRSPVKRLQWAIPTSLPQPSRAPVAGLSALAQQTMLAEPQWPVCAVTTRQWRSAIQAGLKPLPEPARDTYQWQIWAYDPTLGTDREVVDPLSLTLSFQGEKDERIQLALDELKEQYPW